MTTVLAVTSHKIVFLSVFEAELIILQLSHWIEPRSRSYYTSASGVYSTRSSILWLLYMNSVFIFLDDLNQSQWLIVWKLRIFLDGPLTALSLVLFGMNGHSFEMLPLEVLWPFFKVWKRGPWVILKWPLTQLRLGLKHWRPANLVYPLGGHHVTEIKADQ